MDFTYRDKKETSTHKLCFFPEGKVEFHISDLFSSSQPSLSMATSQQYTIQKQPSYLLPLSIMKCWQCLLKQLDRRELDYFN